MSVPQPRRLLMIEQGGRGGVADYTGELVRALVPLGWTVDLATADDHLYAPVDGVDALPIFRYVRASGGLIGRLGKGKLKRPLNGLLFLLALPRLVRLARRADVVHTQGWEVPQIGLVAMLCLGLARRPVVQTAHGTFERASSYLRTRRAVRELTARLSVATIVHTQADLGRLSRYAAAHAVVIPHGEYGGLARGGGSAERGAARTELGIDPDVHVTLMFGQLRTDKGLGDLIGALRRLPGLHLLIGGQEAGALAEHAQALADPALAGRITIREGFLEMSQAAELFAAADTVSLPYQLASQSGVLLLAYGFQRPVVVYPVGGMAEAVLDGETGWVCASPDPEALIVSLAAAIEAGPEECLRRGMAGERFAEERYSWDAIAVATDELYREVLGDG